MIYEPPERALAGTLSLPQVVDGAIRLVELSVPSNGRFSQEDLRLLWDAGAELSSWRRARKAMARSAGSFGTPEVTGVVDVLTDWHSLAECANVAGSLLGAWPCVMDRDRVWMPVGVVAGAEDLLTTERAVEARGALHEHAGDIAVSQSARWRGARRALQSATISALASTILEVVRSSLPSEQVGLLRPLLDPIAAVARMSAAAPGTRDPDPSSWPRPFISFAAASMRALAELQSATRGRGVVPFLDTDELYEAWLAVSVRRRLDAEFGSWVAPSSAALAAWVSDEATIELWVKPTIARSGSTMAGRRLHALVAEALTPDLLLTATRGEISAFAVLDAKSWARMLPEQALEQSAKYMYGIRFDDDSSRVPAISGVDLVTCADAPRIGTSELSRIRVISATPTASTDDLDRRIREVTDQLIASLVAGEQLASEL